MKQACESLNAGQESSVLRGSCDTAVGKAHIGVTALLLQPLIYSNFLLVHTLGGNKQWLKEVCFCHLHGTPDVSVSGLAWPGHGCCESWFRSRAMTGDLSLVTLPLKYITEANKMSLKSINLRFKL